MNPYKQYLEVVVQGEETTRMGVTWLSGLVTITRGQQCGNCGAVVDLIDKTQHENFHAVFSNRKDDTMSTVLWCDYGDHAFKKGTPGSASFNGSNVNEDGINENVSLDACPDHNPMRANPKVIAKELEAEYPVSTPPRTTPEHNIVQGYCWTHQTHQCATITP